MKTREGQVHSWQSETGKLVALRYSSGCKPGCFLQQTFPCSPRFLGKATDCWGKKIGNRRGRKLWGFHPRRITQRANKQVSDSYFPRHRRQPDESSRPGWPLV